MVDGTQIDYSFCIITDGKEPEKTLRLVASIRSQNIPEYEILIGGDVPDELARAADKTIAMPEKARMGRLGAMRNALVREAKGNVLAVLDDDLVLHPDWYAGMVKYGDDFDVLACRILNPDGSRYWDWKIHIRGYNELVPYNETPRNISLTGGVCIARAAVLNSVQWDEQRGFYQLEDVDFTDRIKQAGFRIAFNPYSTTTHDAPYRQDGRFVVRC